MDLNLGYDENFSSPYMERVKRAQLGGERFEGVAIFRNSGRARPELRIGFLGNRIAGVRPNGRTPAYHTETPNGVAPPQYAE